MANHSYRVTVNTATAAKAAQLHEISRTGDQRRGPNQSLESFLSDLVTVAIIERAELIESAYGAEVLKKPAAREGDRTETRIRA